MKMVKILVADDDPKIRRVLRQGLEDAVITVVEAEDGQNVIDIFQKEQPDLILMDIKMPGMNGLEAMTRIKALDEDVPVVILSAYPDAKIIVQAMKDGALDFLIKPFDIDMVRMVIQKTLERKGLILELQSLKKQLEDTSAYRNFIGESRVVLEIKQQIEQVAESGLSILIVGESGTGKEIVARLLHQRSNRRNKDFIEINCAALPEDLLDDELFGPEVGIFAKLDESESNPSRLPEGATVLFDCIDEMAMPLQSRLLQILDNIAVLRLGSERLRDVAPRIISTTNTEIRKSIEERLFRGDLYFRLNEVTISLPPLRTREGDIPLLYQHFMSKYAAQYNKDPMPLTEAIERDLESYPWPGNVRELESFVKRMVVLGYYNALRQLTGPGSFCAPMSLRPPERQTLIEKVPSSHPPASARRPESFTTKEITQEVNAVAGKQTIGNIKPTISFLMPKPVVNLRNTAQKSVYLANGNGIAVIPLQSGSNGNCIYVESSGTRLLIDAGISGIRAESRLAESGFDIRSVDAVLLTHDHVDHSKNIGVYHRKYGLGIWATENTFREAEYIHNIGIVQEPHFFKANTRFTIRNLTIEAIRTPHDAVEGVVFVIDNGVHRLGVLTDLGHIFPQLPELIESLDAVVIESNHDIEMLKNCVEYPDYLKWRIRGKGGHLSNCEAARLLRHSGGRLRWACLAHLSEKANCPEVALEEHRRMLPSGFSLFLAGRDGCSPMMTL